MPRARPSLAALLPPPGAAPPGSEEILDRFLGWLAESGLEPFPHQEEALLELLAGRHVVLGTPTGSGKSLVAVAFHFAALCRGRRSFYTCPVKALASEKFFALCEDFGAENVAMLTGDASINPTAPIVCCTTEVLANMALRQGEALDAPCVVMDEFHYYADRERGIAWQIPLLELASTQFLLMSATLGNPAVISAHLRERTGRDVAEIFSDVRPVPLDFEYRETPLHETIEHLLEDGRAPVYVVNFTQRECAEQAQALTSVRLCGRERRRVLADAIADFRFDSAYGRDFRRFVGHGIGLHHAGLLPKYRLLVEQLAQAGRLVVICGTDTLGVGVNIPIRTVVFTRLYKFDGERVGILSVREFKQISGRAGRKGFDDRGSVVCQAPGHVIENKRLAERAARGRRRRPPRKVSPPRDYVPFDRNTFERLIARPPEMLRSCFRVTHGMVVSLLQREGVDRSRAGGYRALMALIGRSHESDRSKARLRRHAARLVRALRRAGVAEVVRDPRSGGSRLRVNEDLQFEFSLHHTLSLYLVEAIRVLDRASPQYALEVLSLVEAILSAPRPVLLAQTWKAKRELLARLKAERVPYDERMRRLDRVRHPQPLADFIHESFHLFAERHPWVREESIEPKSVAREMFEGYRGFSDYVREYELARFEGTLLRYLSQVHNTLIHSVPENARSEGVVDAILYLRTTLERVDSSLIEEWESLLEPAAATARGEVPAAPFDLAAHPALLAARVRAELHGLVSALVAEDWEEAARCVRQDPEDPWDAARFEAALRPYRDEYDHIVFTPEARRAHHTRLVPVGPRRWRVSQVLVDPHGDDTWALHGEVDLREAADREAGEGGPLVRLWRIGT